MADLRDGETTVNIIGRHGINWTVITDPAESRWWLGDDVSVVRGFTGWYVNVAGRDVGWHRKHRDALMAAIDAYMTGGRDG